MQTTWSTLPVLPSAAAMTGARRIVPMYAAPAAGSAVFLAQAHPRTRTNGVDQKGIPVRRPSG